MQVITRINEIRTSTRKVRIVADAVRGLSVAQAQDALSVINKRGANDLDKALKSAIANAVNNSKMGKNNLVVKSIDVNEGAFLKRFRPSTRGRVHPYKKRTSNIRIVLEDKSEIQSTKSETNLKENNDKHIKKAKEVAK